MKQMIVILCVAGLCACQPNQSGEIAALRSEIETLRNGQATADAAILQQVATLSAATQKKAAILDPGEEGYSSMATTIGTLLLSVEKVEPMADGSQVTLQVGNPYAVSLLGINLQVAYGARQGTQNYGEWSASLKTKAVSLVSPIYSGSWNRIKFTLPGIKPSDLGYMAVTGDIDRLTLTPR